MGAALMAMPSPLHDAALEHATTEGADVPCAS